MNAKVLATLMFALVPSLASAQSGDQAQGKPNQSGNEAGQASASGKNGNGSDAQWRGDPER